MDIQPVRVEIEELIKKVIRYKPTVKVVREDISEILAEYPAATKDQLLREYLLLSDSSEEDAYTPPAEYPRGKISGTLITFLVTRPCASAILILIVIIGFMVIDGF